MLTCNSKRVKRALAHDQANTLAHTRKNLRVMVPPPRALTRRTLFLSVICRTWMELFVDVGCVNRDGVVRSVALDDRDLSTMRNLVWPGQLNLDWSLAGIDEDMPHMFGNRAVRTNLHTWVASVRLPLNVANLKIAVVNNAIQNFHDVKVYRLPVGARRLPVRLFVRSVCYQTTH